MIFLYLKLTLVVSLMELNYLSSFIFLSQNRYAQSIASPVNPKSKESSFSRNFEMKLDDVPENSVHLKLTQQFNYHAKENTTNAAINNKDNQHTVLILEYIAKHNESTILASIGPNVTRLEIFSHHVYKANLSADSSVVLRERKIDTQNSSAVDEILLLWKSEKLLAQSKDPINRSKSKDDFMDLVLSHASRIKMLRRDNESDSKLVAFMERVTLTDFKWSDVSYNASLGKSNLLVQLKQIAIWFRSQFPYYYSGCDSCGKKGENEFVGYIYPSQEERAHQAGRTELYQCTTCTSRFRFPRFNAFGKVLSTRKGRCGEYSIVMLKLLQRLGYNARWVVDWADHVWVEAFVGDAWVHVDPCEAAVDEPLLYQGWGKNQTYILAFTDTSVEDVTAKYTTDMEAALKRRETTPDRIEEGIRAAEELLRTL